MLVYSVISATKPSWFKSGSNGLVSSDVMEDIQYLGSQNVQFAGNGILYDDVPVAGTGRPYGIRKYKKCVTLENTRFKYWYEELLEPVEGGCAKTWCVGVLPENRSFLMRYVADWDAKSGAEGAQAILIA